MPLLVRLGGLGLTLGGPPVAGQIATLSSCGCARSLAPSEGANWDGGGFGWRRSQRIGQLGAGRKRWFRAANALETAEGLDLPWAKWWRCGAGSRWAAGDVVVVGARVLPLLWAVNVNTVTHVNRERRRVQVQWATTRRHVLRGRESLSVERRGDEVTLEILQISRPEHIVAWFMYPVVALLQAKFATDVCRRFRSISDSVV